MTWAEAARLAVSSHVRDLALLRQSLPQATRLPDARRAGRSAGSADHGRRTVGRGGSSSGGSQAIADQAQRLVPGDGLRLPVRPDPQAVLDRLPGPGRRRSTRATTTCSPPRRASPASSRSPRATSPPDHWFRLGRALTPVGRGSALISWSGSMFEYLMPALVMRAPAGSLLDQTYRLVVARQIALRRRARRAVGHLRVGVQRPRPRADLPVLELRRARPRPEARPQRGPRRRPVRHRARRR